ncbi:assimilatory sulfite reductase (NADPH) hemoprotein subunit [Hyalangium minutum]|uniref:Sulfite reductase [NADPH] hemoprotein beta-component n=1 Tax=Hyalangium minutum TaxID=394096 RepID=A0A085WWI9_9BACT|nr:assimilatory sulfite reductase (NADPH) hemoprotein subunit [Hyalangium minutum]KFE72052.1 Sulfite reductase [NADPH] hemoprotein beta-component [Hyalangium minutum]
MSTPTKPPALSEAEQIKAKSRRLRGTLVESLADPVTGGLAPADQNLIKFHGSYQQDNRDVREERRQQKLEPAYDFMIRTRLPGGVATPAQWLALDALAQKYANGTLRLTTRQAFQLHGVIKTDLKRTMQGINAALLDTIAACGDVNRNVMCNPNPVDSRVHEEAHQWAVKLSEHLLPKTRAYYEVWLDKEKVAGSGEEEEPILGATYLPRKFKAAIAVPPINDVDVFSQDLGFIAIHEEDRLLGFNVTVGGGMGATHGDAATFPRLADVIGFILPEQLLAVAENVVKVQRDYGDRTTRKHARLKYTIEDRGIAWFVSELESRLGFSLQPTRPFTFEHNGDLFGWREGHDGRWHLTLRLESGRVADTPGARMLTGLREIAQLHPGDFRLTPNQNLIIAGVTPEWKEDIDSLVEAHGLGGFRRASPLRLNALACVALPTCGLAMAEAERYLPDIVGKLEERLAAHGLQDEKILLRITGCPNGCARPYLAEIALVGKAPGRYNLFLGGDVRGQRLNRLYRENIDEAGVLAALEPLFSQYARERRPGEGFGDFTVRAGHVSSPPASPPLAAAASR